MVFGFRPLSIKELQTAAPIQTGMMTLNDDDLPLEDDLMPITAGLETADTVQGVVRLINYTAQKHFEKGDG